MDIYKNCWTNRVTLYSLCGGSYLRTAVFEDCFWKREDSFIYENGRRRKLRKFIVRIPSACLIEPGDALVLGECCEDAGDEFFERHLTDAFRVEKVLISEGTRCGGTSIG